MKKIFRCLLTFSLAFSALIFVTPSSAVDKTPISDYGNNAIRELATCLRTSESLDVFYLIDASSSLEKTDPKNLRADIIAQDIKRWAQIGEVLPNLTINVAGAKFSAQAQFLANWQSLTTVNASSVAKRFTSTIDNSHLSNFTNWRTGLERAYGELSTRPSSCKAVIWFTDGGLWSPGNNRKDSLKDLAYLCGSASDGDVPHDSSSAGLMADIRRAGIHVYGILLHTGKDSESEEPFYRSLMKPLIEESGNVTPIGKLPSGQKAMKCGENLLGNEKTYASGAFLEATSAADVAFKFMKIPAIVSGATEANCHKDGRFEVDPGISKIEFATDATSWRILDSDEKIFASSASVGDYGTTSKLSLPNLKSSEVWTFKYSGGQGLCSLYVYPELYLELHDKALVSGRESSITGQFFSSLTSHEKVDLSIYKSSNLSAVLDGLSVPANLNTEIGSFEIPNYKPAAGLKTVDVGATLKLETEHYKLDPISFEVPKSIYPDTLLPEIGRIKFNSELAGKDGVAQATVTVKPPSDTSFASKVCFNQPKVIGDHQNESAGKSINRESKWAWAFGGLDSNRCIEFLRGVNREQQVSFKLSNDQQADSHGEALFDYVYSAGADGIVTAKDSQTASFTSSEIRNQGLFWFWLFIALLVGFLVPVSILNILNYMNAFYSSSDLLRAEIPVRFDPLSKTFTASGVDVYNSDALISYFNPVTLSSSKVRQFSDPSGNSLGAINTKLNNAVIDLKAKVVLWKPLSGPHFSSSPRENSFTIVKEAEGIQADGSQNLTTSRLSKLVYLHVDKTALQAANGTNAQIDATLVVFAPKSILAGDTSLVTDAMASQTISERLNALLETKAKLSVTETDSIPKIISTRDEDDFGSASSIVTPSNKPIVPSDNGATGDIDFS